MEEIGSSTSASFDEVSPSKGTNDTRIHDLLVSEQCRLQNDSYIDSKKKMTLKNKEEKENKQ